MSKAYAAFAKKKPTQREPLDKRQVTNNAGGFVYALDMWKAMERFLILGTEGGTYYASERQHTLQAGENTKACIAQDGKRAVDLIVAISDSGRAANNDPALLALALASAADDTATRLYALAALPKVARIPTHLFHYVDYVTGLRGWSRSLRTAIGRWYTERDARNLAHAIVKYQSRDGWSNKDVITLAHPVMKNATQGAIFNWIMRGAEGITELTPQPILAFEEAKHASATRIAALIRAHRMTFEMLPTQALTEPVVWEALLEKMPLTALIRNLGRLSSLGLTSGLSEHTTHIIKQLASADALKKARVHPMQLLMALKTYSSGHGFRGSASWPVNTRIVDALDTAFYASFGNVTPTGKALQLALDVSGSMGTPLNNSNLTCREAAAAMALITANVESHYVITGFTAGGRPGGRGYMSGDSSFGYRSPRNAISELAISPKQRLDDVVRSITNLTFGMTDCALPMLLASAERWHVDAFCIYTDNETYAGSVHPMQALKDYRKQSGIADAKLIVTGMTSTGFTIADPLDPYCLDLIGFDANAPQAISTFVGI